MTWAGSYRATPAVQDFTSATTFAVNKAAGTVAGDLILLWCGGNASGNGAFTCPGFANQTGSPFTSRGQLLTRTADGTEGSTFTVTSTAGATPAEVVQATVAGPCSIDVVGAVAARYRRSHPGHRQARGRGLRPAGGCPGISQGGGRDADRRRRQFPARSGAGTHHPPLEQTGGGAGRLRRDGQRAGHAQLAPGAQDAGTHLCGRRAGRPRSPRGWSPRSVAPGGTGPRGGQGGPAYPRLSAVALVDRLRAGRTDRGPHAGTGIESEIRVGDRT